MRPTRVRFLVALAVVVGVLTWAALRVLKPSGTVSSLPTLPWTLPAALLLVAAGVFVAALGLRARLSGRPGAKPVDPLHAARMAVLAKACSHAGAALAGGYAGFAVWLLPDLAPPARRDEFLMALFSALASVVLVVAGLVLERICRLPEPPEGEPGVPGEG